MRWAGLVGRLFTLACLIGLILAWPYVEKTIAGTWLSDLHLIVAAVFVIAILSLLHAIEVWVAGRFSAAKETES